MRLFREFEKAGKLLFQQHLISAAAGNLSIREKDTAYVTATGSMLGFLEFSDIVKVPLESSAPVTLSGIYSKKPSMEIETHLNIYRNTGFKAVCHAHPSTALALAFNAEKINPVDSEGCYYLPEIPVISVEKEIASAEVARLIPEILAKFGAVIIRNHGAFTAGETLHQACGLMSTVEFSSEIIFKKRLLGSL